jgi:hypothetical protein
MKKTSFVLICLFVFANFTFAGKPAADAKMTEEERAKVVKSLLDTQKELMDMIVNLTDEQWNFRPAPFKWTVGQTAEHIALGEGLLFGQVERTMAAPVNPDWEAKTAKKEGLILGPVAMRGGKAQAPDPIQPIGKNMSRAEIMKLLKEGREKSLKFAKETNGDLKSHTTEHPFPVFGTLNAYQWLLYVPAHNARHNKQIAEIKANPNFPRAQ